MQINITLFCVYMIQHYGTLFFYFFVFVKVMLIIVGNISRCIDGIDIEYRHKKMLLPKQ